MPPLAPAAGRGLPQICARRAARLRADGGDRRRAPSATGEGCRLQVSSMTWRVRCGEPRARSALCEPRRAFSSGARNVGGSGRASRDAHLARRALASSERCTGSRASCKLRTGGCARPLPPTLEVPVLKRPLNSARSQLLAHRARTLRAQPTLAEAKLWFALAGSQLGVAFRRQVVVGERIVLPQ